MKKTLSVILAAAMSVTALCQPASAEDISVNADTKDSIVILGDSIAKGTLRNGAVEHRYGDICADYLGWDAEYVAQDGWRTDDLKNALADGSEGIQLVKDAEAVVISIGGNNLIRHACKYILDYAAQINSTSTPVLKNGYTADNLPEDPTMEEVQKIVDTDVLKAYFMSKPTEANPFLNKLKIALAGTNQNPTGYVQTEIVPETKEIISMIKAVNPDVDIILQTVYQPLQLSKEYVDSILAETSNSAVYSMLLTQMRTNFESAMLLYREEMLKIEDVKLADIYYEFRSMPCLEEKPGLGDVNNNNQGYAHYFTDIESGGISLNIAQMDFHPNQKGHLAIAAAVLEQINILHDDTGLLSQIYNSLEDKDSYPAVALETYEKVAGAPVETTTTTSTTTTTTTTTTTVTTTTSPTSDKNKLGDLNGDDKITPVDASVALMAYAKKQTQPDSSAGYEGLTSSQIDAADVNKDGSITPVDAAQMLRYYSYCQTVTNPDDIISFEEFVA